MSAWSWHLSLNLHRWVMREIDWIKRIRQREGKYTHTHTHTHTKERVLSEDWKARKEVICRKQKLSTIRRRASVWNCWARHWHLLPTACTGGWLIERMGQKGGKHRNKKKGVWVEKKEKEKGKFYTTSLYDAIQWCPTDWSQQFHLVVRHTQTQTHTYAHICHTHQHAPTPPSTSCSPVTSNGFSRSCSHSGDTSLL